MLKTEIKVINWALQQGQDDQLGPILSSTDLFFSGHAVDGATAENTDNLGDTRGLEHLGDTGVLENLGDTRGLANMGDTGDLENLGDTAELDKLSEDPNCREVKKYFKNIVFYT